MRESVVVATIHDPADVHGVHSAEGHSRWTCLARRTGLHGRWEAVEWAWLPPGGVSGEHRHSRTEELYFVLDGQGEITLDGRRYPVRPGTTVLTALGRRHGLRNTGRQPLSWLVIEIPADADPPPSTKDAVMHNSAHVSHAVVADLRRSGPVDAATVLTGPLRTVRVTRLHPRGTAELAARDVEHTVYVTDGVGTVETGATTVALAPGVSVTLPLGTGARVRAGADGLEYFHAVLDVPREDHQ
ncbi:MULTISPECIES: cupin domain-containing protein [unclassified Streptomyces]|uniref:Cupin domain-containing protein n=1 Tax=Streptomyces sp. NBC_00060 TaxID=2975636 RepID=A0AAU2H8B5_9ACTN